jgi:soluble lytic murein transglycosylase-like protein
MSRYLVFVYAVLFALVVLMSSVEALGGEEIYGPIIREEAIAHGLDPVLVLSIAEVESRFNPNAVGSLGELGLLQLRPEFHPVVKGDTRHNIRVGVRYLASIKSRCSLKYGDAWFVCFNRGEYRKALKAPREFPYYKKVKAAYERRQVTYVGH